MQAAVMAAISLALTVVLAAVATPMLSREPFLKQNYAGRKIPTSMGVLFIPVFIAAYLVSAGLYPPDGNPVPPPAFILLISGMGFLGFMDDVLGSRAQRGFRGHITALLEGKITTGLFKAAAGLLIALGVSYMIGGPLWEVVLNGFLIALCANLYNLLDIRPGRAIKCFLPVLGLVITVNWSSNHVFASYLLSTGCISIALFYGDLKEKFMLGDAGSNVLGAIIGISVAVSVPPLWRLVVLVAVLALNLLSEAVSFSSIIDSVGALKWIDRLGRKGLEL
ncbi:MAG: hypothetical protein JXA49_08180 [Actinobacteria bacterium]|nr:hypothetical protein [Actinomycetota bacterium]